MPGRYCVMYGCNNRCSLTKINNPEIVYHNIPKGKDYVSTTIRKEWIRRCERAGTLNSGTSQICSIHFSENDYDRDMRNEILGLPTRKLLKKSAIPTLFLPNKSKNEVSFTRQERPNKSKNVASSTRQKRPNKSKNVARSTRQERPIKSKNIASSARQERFLKRNKKDEQLHTKEEINALITETTAGASETSSFRRRGV